MKKEIFVGLDVGTDSVGYAVTDREYNPVKHKGESMWGTTIFEAAETKEGRRAFRTARRRLDRRQQRVVLTQEIFAKEIAKVDEKFFVRLKESALHREDTSIDSTYFLFEEKGFSDINYHDKYPTIHHLIQDLIQDESAKDVRLVYLAVAWLMAHRGHFLNEVDKKNITNVLDFNRVYEDFVNACEYSLWEVDREQFQKVMLLKISVTKKEKAFNDLLNGGKKFKDSAEETISRAAIVKLLSGGKVKPDSIFLGSEYSEMDSVSLSMDEENFANIVSELDDDGELLLKLRALYDWALLADILSGSDTISDAKVKLYDRHREDLAALKAFVKKYIPKKYFDIFRKEDAENYAAYSGHNTVKKCNKDTFSAFLLKHVKNIDVDEEDVMFYQDMIERLELRSFLPKQVNGDNRVIPYQLYWHELNAILENAKEYLPFLTEKDADGYSGAEKLLSIFEFRVPYFVGPLRVDNSKNSWMKRKAGAVGKIYPWNFDDMVDLDTTEQAFINRMTNKCAYLPGEDVIPKGSLLYTKFMVLNEINNIKVNGIDIPVEVKQQIFEKFKEYKKVSVKKIHEVLKATGCLQEGDIVSGLDITVKSSLSSYHAFKNLLNSKILTEDDVEEIIRYITYSEDKKRLKEWLDKKYSHLSVADRKYVAHLKIKDFGRLSQKFLTEFEGVNKKTGGVTTIISALWNTNDNLMQILSDKYTFAELIEEERKAFYAEHDHGIDAMLDDMYISNSVKRPIYRTLAILDDIRKATKTTPKRIFIEMARGGGEKGKRTKSRRAQIEELYAGMDKQEVRDLSKQLESRSDNELQSEVLFLYFMQMGRCMYSGQAINIELLKTSKYNVDHIYPQSKVMDDSLTNKVLVLSELNALKGDNLVLPQFREKMASTWAMLKNNGMMSEEKYKRLMRNIPFSDTELQGFINRQLVETRQSTKALADILQKLYPETEIVYVKAGIVSEFRKDFEIVKSRSINDLHHGKDAYLNIVCGNVYHCRFTKHFTTSQHYSLRVRNIFTHKVNENGTPVWYGEESIAKVKKVMAKNNLHFTRFAFERKGGLFDQMPMKKGKGVVPRKANLPIDKYGGYNKSTASFFMLVKYRKKKKTDIMFMPVDLYVANRVTENEEFAFKYAKGNIANILGKQECDIEIIDFPLGLRKLKVNTMLSLNGFRVVITGKSSGGKQLGFSSMEALKLTLSEEVYIKKLERFLDKKREKTISKIDEVYDKISATENLKLYDVFIEKLLSKKFQPIFGENYSYMIDAREKFSEMTVEDQVVALMNILSIFKTGRAGACDLSGIGRTEKSAACIISSKLSNLKKYEDIRIIDASPSGIYETVSDNLLELL